MSSSLYGNYRTNTFLEVFPETETYSSNYANFKAQYDASIFEGAITADNLELLFYFLYARYGNNHIANSDETQFKYKLFATIWQFGPVWEKKLEVQEDLRGLTLDELRQGTGTIGNHAYNPSVATPSDGIVAEINEQDTTNYKKSKADAYATIMDLMEQDVTEEFIVKFKPLFIIIAEPQAPLLYGEV